MKRAGSTPGIGPKGHRGLRGFILLSCLASAAVPAESPPARVWPESLKDLKPAAGACPPANAAPLSPAPAQGKTGAVPPDLSCALAPALLSQRLKAPDTVLADVRTAAEYEAFHIEGALNATAAELGTRRFLRDKTVVLIGTGKAEREQYAACARLKSQGFKRAKVLQGGLPAWLAAGYAVQGRAPGAGSLTRLSPAELWIESRFQANLVLVSRARNALRRQLPGAVPLSEDSPAALRAAVGRRPPGHGPWAAVVLVTDRAPEALAPLRQAIQPVPLLAYTDTVEAFARQVGQQEAIRAAQARGPKQPGCGR